MKALRVKSLVFVTIAGDVFFFFMSYWILTYFSLGLWRSAEVQASVVNFLPFAAAVFFLMMTAFDMYTNIFYRSKTDTILTVTLAITISTFLSLAMAYLVTSVNFSKQIPVIAGGVQVLSLSAWRIVVWFARKGFQQGSKQKMLVVGHLEDAKNITRKLLQEQGHIFDIQYVYDVAHPPEGAYKLIDAVDHVMLCGKINPQYASDISNYCMRNNKNVFVIPDTYSINLNRATLIQVQDVPMYKLSKFGLSPEQKFIKRAVDILVSAVGIVLASPIMLMVVVMMKLTNPGPILFKQERVTMDNKLYNVWKFRTMVVNAEAMTGPVLAQEKDPRITPIGGFMRSTRIDELPQLFNVLGGSMSLIGPRPERAFFIEQFVQETPEFAYRTAVKAGVTGLAQVLGKYTTSFEDKLRYDLVYIKNYSLMMDVKILLKTVKVVLTKEASSGEKQEEVFEDFLMGIRHRPIKKDFGYMIIETKGDLFPIKEKRPAKAGAKNIAG